MRIRPVVATAALISAVALVVAVGPAGSRAPGPPLLHARDAFQPLTLERPPRSTTTPPIPVPEPSPTIVPVDDLGLPASRPPVRSTRPPAILQPAASPIRAPAPPWSSARYSWYGPGFYGSGTACGQTYTKAILGVAHRSLPCGTMVTFRNPRNGRTVTVPVIDRGPYVAGRTWDLSAATCAYLDACYTATIDWRLPWSAPLSARRASQPPPSTARTSYRGWS